VKETILTLIEIVTANSLAISELNKAQAQNAAAIAGLSSSVVTLHDSTMTLHNDVTALAAIVKAHDGEIQELKRLVESVTKQWQAYINTLPKS
jgi:hypothetical protein